MEKKKKNGLSTKAIHSFDPEEWSWNPLVLPIVSATCFQYGEGSNRGDYYYSRYGSPTLCALEKALASLEDARYGVCFSSGISSTASIVQLLRSGDHIVCSELLYGGTTYYLKNFAANFDIEISVVDCSNLKLLENSLKSNTKCVILEALSNPTLQIFDIEEISKLTATRKDTMLVVDNTFLTPVFLKPLNLGADVVFHSLTKYMNGHGDVTMGVVLTNNEDIYKNLKMIQSGLGSVPSPFDCYLVHRSLKTLNIRMREHMNNATAVASFLEKQEKVDKVVYPGLVSHPQHELAKKQFSGFGGMVTVYLKGGRTAVDYFINNLNIFAHTGSLGFVESIVSHPWSVSHEFLDEDEKNRLDIRENMVRLSVGLEDEQDLLDDLTQALESI